MYLINPATEITFAHTQKTNTPNNESKKVCIGIIMKVIMTTGAFILLK